MGNAPIIGADTGADAVQVGLAANGLEVHLLAGAAGRSSLACLCLESPLEEDREAHALLPDLLTRGTARSPGLAAMTARCEELFDLDLSTSVTAWGPVQRLRLGFEALADRFAGGRRLFDEGLELLREVIHDPPLVGGRFRADHLGQERDNLVRALAGLRDDRPALAWRRLQETLHAGTAWALHPWGDERAAAALSEPAVRRAHERLRGSLAGRLVVVADLHLDQALEAAELLGGPGRRPTPAAPRLPPPPLAAVADAREVLDVQQSQLVLGYHVDRARLAGPAAALLATVLGGGSHSRLFKAVRESAGLAYGCSASLLVDTASLVVQAGIHASQAERVEALVAAELAALAGGRLEERELQISRLELQRRLDGLRDSPRDLVQHRLFALAAGREHRLDAAAAALAATRVDDVVAVAGATRLAARFLLEGGA